MLIISHWEHGFRSAIIRHYDFKVTERREALKEAEERRERQRKRWEAERQALLDLRQRLLHDALSNVTRADQIRMLIQALDERMDSRAGDVPAFQHWRKWALVEANAVDPRLRTAEEWMNWVNQFQLDA
jgi:hypothetical protein